MDFVPDQQKLSERYFWLELEGKDLWKMKLKVRSNLRADPTPEV
jgi:hypothetical protein